jgi:hypothetical protein
MDCRKCERWIPDPSLGVISDSDYRGAIWGRCIEFDLIVNLDGIIQPTAEENAFDKFSEISNCPLYIEKQEYCNARIQV